MKQVISSEKKPIKLWLDDIEEGALKQAYNIANLPFIFKHVAIMPDSHQGYGMPIGGVMATKGVVIPNAVGVDIGCGMCSLKTNLTEISTDNLKLIMGLIRELVPVGFEHQKEVCEFELMPGLDEHMISEKFIVWKEFENARKQLGTLGGGNHFIEIQKGSDGFIWIMIHSGSRNLGYKVAKYYNNLAVSLNNRWYSEVKKELELAFLPIESQEAKNYMNEMNYCVEFALANRTLMMDRIKESFLSVIPDIKFSGFINIAHNYAKWENHYKTNVIIHRKGATSARLGEYGIIPGSQGTKSYIVAGLGNAESFNSCSHGAGRKMGRKQAIRELDFDKEVKKLDNMGIIHSVRNVKDLDEAPGAYKDIDIVMENQKDLVEIMIELKPLAVIKG